MTGDDTTGPGPAALPEGHGFRHVLGAEEPGAVAREYPPSRAADGRGVVRTVYHSGRSPGLRARGAEFELQLHGQYQVLSQVPAQDYLAARDLFHQEGRQGAEATRRARRHLTDRLAEYGRDHLDMSRAEARAWAGEAMRQVAVLHNPDQVLGGGPEPARDASGAPVPGDRGVNSSLGAQNLPNAAVVDAAARRQVAAGRGHLPLGFQVVLTARRRSVRRLRARQPAPPLQEPAPQPDRDQPAPVRAAVDPPTAPRPPPPGRTPTPAEDIRRILGISTPTTPGAAGGAAAPPGRSPVPGTAHKKTPAEVLEDIARAAAADRATPARQTPAPRRPRRHRHTL